jgi:hypothetical protein
LGDAEYVLIESDVFFIHGERDVRVSLRGGGRQNVSVRLWD